MWLLLLSFVAGLLTVLAPCVLPILPVIIGRSATGSSRRSRRIIGAFALSVLVFTLLLKVLVMRLGITPDTLTKLSAGLLVIFGIFLLMPDLRTFLMHLSGLETATQRATRQNGSGLGGDLLLGFLLGPIFNSCSPTYAILVSTILPVSFLRGLVNILLYILGVCLMLALVVRWGRKLISKLRRAADPHGRFRIVMGVLLIVVGVAVRMKRDKQAEAWLLDQHIFPETIQREIKALKEVSK